MRVEIRPAARLRGANAVELLPALGPALDAVIADPEVDLTRLRVTADWLQYRRSFRPPVMLVPSTGGDGLELAVDLRRADDPAATAGAVAAALRAHRNGGSAYRPLEDWTPASRSVIWRFNTLYWQHLRAWEEATGRGYESALPGGRSGARENAPVHAMIEALFAVWDSLAQRRALPEELYVVELGVGNGSQARTWLDAFRELDAERGHRYYRRLHYLMGDYSPHVLERARAAVADHANHVSSLVLDAQRPTTALGFLRFKVFLVYISNVYDNLPTDEIATIGQRDHLVQTRAYFDEADAVAIAASVSAAPDALGGLVDKLLHVGPTLLAEAAPAHVPDPAAGVAFWRACWSALRLQERYVPLDGLDTYEIAPGISGELLRPMTVTGGDLRLHAAIGAVASFADTLPLLHPFGRLLCHDIFVTATEQYRTGFRGPGKYDGSVVNWVNGPLLAYIGARMGFDVAFTPFAHPGSNIVTLTADVRD